MLDAILENAVNNQFGINQFDSKDNLKAVEAAVKRLGLLPLVSG